MKKRLSPKQKLFVDEYLIDLNASAAARRAGYSPKWINANVQRTLQNTAIQAEIQKRMAARSERTAVTQDRVILEYARLAFLDPRKFFDENGRLISIHKLSEDVAAAIAGIDVKRLVVGEDEAPAELVKIKLTDKRASLQDVARHLGMFEKDNAQRGKVDQEARQAFMADLFSAIGSATGRGLPKPREDRDE